MILRSSTTATKWSMPLPTRNGFLAQGEQSFRVLAGCCWEVQATRTTPSESLASLHEVAKCLTMELAVYLAKEVAAILRAVLTHGTKKLYNDSTVHLLCSNYWVQPIYQELLHSSSRRNVSVIQSTTSPMSVLAWI